MSWFPFIPQKVIICFLFSKFQYEFIDLSIFSVFQSIEITIQFVTQIVPFFFCQWELFLCESWVFDSFFAILE